MTLREIITEVGRKYGLSFREMIDLYRDAPRGLARNEAYWRCRAETGHTTVTIARVFRRNHSTIIKGSQRHDWRLHRTPYAQLRAFAAALPAP